MLPSKKPKPFVASCGCWHWCETCHGKGKIETQHQLYKEVKDCDECNGVPPKLKHCGVCAAGANWGVVERKGK